LWRNSKGVSGIIAAIFLVLIVILLYSNVFVFMLDQDASFQDVVSEVNQMDVDRSTEQITVTDVNHTVVGDQVHIEAQVTNDGAVSVQINTLWVVDRFTKKYGNNNTLTISLKPGDTLSFGESNALKVTIEGSSSLTGFTSWFVTARGNLIPLEEQETIIVAQVALGIGAMAMDLGNFRYFTYESATKLVNYSTGTVSFDIPKNTYIAYGCFLTNFDTDKRTITIDSHSFFWQPGAAGIGEENWFIVNVEADGTINGTYTSISIAYGETKMLVFASGKDVGTDSFLRERTPNADGVVATFLLLHGTIGSSAFSQNIPFVSFYYYS
jgi:FlaG/FlaF family flagellin (archaellin)